MECSISNLPSACVVATGSFFQRYSASGLFPGFGLGSVEALRRVIYSVMLVYRRRAVHPVALRGCRTCAQLLLPTPSAQ
jgi:hypothetical protein